MPLAEKYSLRKSFRRMGRGAAAMGSCLDEDTVRCRFAWVSGTAESRARHLKQTEPCGGKFNATRFGRSGIPGEERYSCYTGSTVIDGHYQNSAGLLGHLRNTHARIARLHFNVSPRNPSPQSSPIGKVKQSRQCHPLLTSI